MLLPKFLSENEIVIPPILIQGSKLSILSLILSNIYWEEEGVYYEPFMGSGIIAFNIKPKHAILSDINPHIINLYRAIQTDTLDLTDLYEELWEAKRNLKHGDGKYFYEIRDRFNKTANSIDFLILIHTCYRHLCRFNSLGEFNAPFCFDKTRYLTNDHDEQGEFIDLVLKRIKIIQDIIKKSQYEFLNLDFMNILPMIKANDFVYLDPPYLLRNTQYFQGFTPEQNHNLTVWINKTPCNYAESNWYSDSVQINPLMKEFTNAKILKFNHEYVIGNGSGKTKHKKIKEALIINPRNIVKDQGLLKYT